MSSFPMIRRMSAYARIAAHAPALFPCLIDPGHDECEPCTRGQESNPEPIRLVRCGGRKVRLKIYRPPAVG